MSQPTEKAKAPRNPTDASSSKEEPDPKRAKTTTTTANATQSNILNFFASSKPKPANTKAKADPPKESVTKPAAAKADPSLKDDRKSAADSSSSEQQPIIIHPKLVQPARNVSWQSYHDTIVLLRKIAKEEPRTKIAAFDLDGTLFVWSAGGGFWPSQPNHYELWSSGVITKLRGLYDNGYKLVLFSNQGGIQKAHQGKKATLVKTVVDWLAHQIDRPVYCTMSTKSPKKSDDSFHKPGRKMWDTMVQIHNKGVDVDLSESFFVGDSAEPDDEQGGVDRRFAETVGIKFYTPTEYFGPSDYDKRQLAKGVQAVVSPPPQQALEARKALLGGYMKGPILLILCGVQGSGKSTFCEQLLQQNNDHWVHLSQDTINNGKPGKRETVEEQTRTSLQLGKSVVVDRMHLDPQQRGYFIEVANSMSAPAHVVLLNPPKEIIAKRVRERTNHPGKVEGAQGAKIAIQSISRIVLPTYSEDDIELISSTSTTSGAKRICDLYRGLLGLSSNQKLPLKPHLQQQHMHLDDTHTMPVIALGTMGVGKRIAKDVVNSALCAGFRAIDTAPSYKNEEQVGDAVVDDADDIFCIVKIPKSVTEPDQVRPALELTLKNLQRKHADLLLLHWPCDVINAGTLATVWKEMERCMKDGGLVKALGVCNFNASALAELLPSCSIRPVVNQVERHPLLPQMPLVDFCARNDILLQAHTPLGQGKANLLEHAVITRIAKETGASPAQVCLQWNKQQGVAVVPKCKSEEHMKELQTCKVLSPDQMRDLDSLGRESHRFVAPPFMYGKGTYCWGERMPTRK
jgi:DNA 3'-phosphatase